MTQQQAMERILKEWIRVSNNVQVLATMSLPTTYNRQVTEKNGLERILKSHGFVYRIITEQKEGEYQVNYIFRKKRVKNFIKVHENWLKKNIGPEWLTTEFKWVEL